MSARWPVQVAIYSALSAALSVPVFDRRPPAGTATPYVTIGPITELTEDAHNQSGMALNIQLDFWSTQSNKQPAELLAEAHTVLHRMPLTVTGWPHVSVAYETSVDSADPENPDLRRISADYRMWLSQ